MEPCQRHRRIYRRQRSAEDRDALPDEPPKIFDGPGPLHPDTQIGDVASPVVAGCQHHMIEGCTVASGRRLPVYRDLPLRPDIQNPVPRPQGHRVALRPRPRHEACQLRGEIAAEHHARIECVRPDLGTVDPHGLQRLRVASGEPAVQGLQQRRQFPSPDVRQHLRMVDAFAVRHARSHMPVLLEDMDIEGHVVLRQDLQRIERRGPAAHERDARAPCGHDRDGTRGAQRLKRRNMGHRRLSRRAVSRSIRLNHDDNRIRADWFHGSWEQARRRQVAAARKEPSGLLADSHKVRNVGFPVGLLGS